MSRRTRNIIGAVTAVGIAAVVVVGLHQAPRAQPTERLTMAEMRTALIGSPSTLDALHRQANELLPGGYDALRKRLRALRGRPVVVNLWAAWCPPCRAEAPIVQQVSTTYGRRIAFIGVNSNDDVNAARDLLKETPVTYPSYVDRPARMESVLQVSGLPATMFINTSGRQVYVHQGQYRSVADLRRDVARLL